MLGSKQKRSFFRLESDRSWAFFSRVIYYSQNNRQKALEFLQDAAEIETEIGSQWDERFTRQDIAFIYVELNDWKSAETQYLRVVEISEVLNHPELELDREILEAIQAQLEE